MADETTFQPRRGSGFRSTRYPTFFGPGTDESTGNIAPGGPTTTPNPLSGEAAAALTPPPVFEGGEGDSGGIEGGVPTTPLGSVGSDNDNPANATSGKQFSDINDPDEYAKEVAAHQMGKDVFSFGIPETGAAKAVKGVSFVAGNPAFSLGGAGVVRANESLLADDYDRLRQRPALAQGVADALGPVAQKRYEERFGKLAPEAGTPAPNVPVTREPLSFVPSTPLGRVGTGDGGPASLGDGPEGFRTDSDNEGRSFDRDVAISDDDMSFAESMGAGGSGTMSTNPGDGLSGDDFGFGGGDSGGGGSGGGGGFGRVVCTELVRRGLMSHATLRTDVEFTYRRLSPSLVQGYHRWAHPYVRLMRRDDLIGRAAVAFIEPLARHRAAEVAYLMGRATEGTWRGKASRFILEGLSVLCGWLTPDNPVYLKHHEAMVRRYGAVTK